MNNALDILTSATIKSKSDPSFDASSLRGKTLGLYFSAHWCPPCRRYTPELVKKYNEITEAGGNFEIVFISSDQDEESAAEYFADMPWKMLEYGSEKKNDIDALYDVDGIPTLVILDGEGNLITMNGREAIMTTSLDKLKDFDAGQKAEEERQAAKLMALKASFSLSAVFDDESIIDNDEKPIPLSSLSGKIVGLYFSAHWCPPCRGFTPALAKKYSEIVGAGSAFEIIFVSSDRDEHTAAEYFSEMPWKMLSYHLTETKATLNELFDVSGIPTLVLLDEKGATITTEGREAIMTVPFEKLKEYEAEKLRAAQVVADKIKLLPDTLKDSRHDHPLVKKPSVYRGQYGCDICGVGGSGWVYHCDECGFDSHPACLDCKEAVDLFKEGQPEE